MGTSGWHCRAQVSGTGGVALQGTGGKHFWAQVGGTDHQGTNHQCPDDHVREVRMITGNCIYLVICCA
ncbi:unnamed protein product, partial [Staurois parvus]